MKIIVTGANGMLGSDLCEILRAKKKFEVIPFYGNDRVVASDGGEWRVASGEWRVEEKLATNHSPLATNYERRIIDITDQLAIETEIVKIKPDIIIHTAAYTDVDGCETNREMAYQVNALGTQNVALAAKKSGAFLIYISTDYIFDGEKKCPYLENDAPDPINVYGKSKLEGERFAQDILNDRAVIRISWLFGINGKNFVKSIIEQIAKSQVTSGKVEVKSGEWRVEGKLATNHSPLVTNYERRILKVVDDQIGSPTYTKDLSKGISFFVEKGCETGIYHLTNQGTCSWFEFAKKIVEVTGNAGKIAVEPVNSLQLTRPAKRPRNSVLENYVWKSKGYPLLRNWEEALGEYLVESGAWTV